MPEYSITSTGNFHHSRLRIIFSGINCHPEIEAAFIHGSYGRVIHTKADKLIIQLFFIMLLSVIGQSVPY